MDRFQSCRRGVPNLVPGVLGLDGAHDAPLPYPVDTRLLRILGRRWVLGACVSICCMGGAKRARGESVLLRGVT